MRNSKDIGDQTEARAVSKLVANGYSVSIPFGDNDKYDLVVDDGSRLYRLQCKTAWSNKERTIRFNTHTQTTKDGAYHEETYRGEIDAFSYTTYLTRRFTGSTRPIRTTRRWSCDSSLRLITRR